MKRNLLLLVLIYFSTGLIFSQTTLKGKVTNLSGEPIPGVNVTIKGTTVGSVTDLNGEYSLGDVSKESVIIFSFIGMLTEETEVGDRTVIDIVLIEDIQSLDEVVVIGYGEVKRRDLTGSVATVKSDDIVISPTNNVLEAIQGKVAGMDIIRSSGAAGSGVDILIRGTRSIHGDNDPLFIIDGVQGASFSDLNSADIESIEVLKDASTTAIYGYQGAGGVVIITTKKAKKGAAKVSYNGYYGINGLTPYPKGRTGEDYINLRREAYRANNHWSSPEDDESIFTPTEWEAIQNNQWVDWIDLILDNGSIQNHQLSVSGGSENTQTYFSTGYFNEIGPIQDDYTKYTVRLNLDQDINKWLKAGIINQVTHIVRNERQDALSKANSTIPLGTPYDEDGQIVIYPTGDGVTLSPLTDLRLNAAVDNTISTRLFSSSYLEIKPVKGITFRSNLGLNLDYSRNGKYNDAYSMAQRNEKVNRAYIKASNNRYINWDNILTYKLEANKHSLTLTALSSYTRNISDYVSATGINQELSSPLFYRLDATDQTSSEISSGYTKQETMSYAGRINYSFAGKYLFTFTERYDQSSVLSKGHKGAFFPSFALAWRLSDENFFQSSGVISNLKPRFSYGESGNSSIDPYGTQSVVVPSMNMSFGEVSAPAYSFGEVLSSAYLEWERSATKNFGLDAGFFKNRINLTLDYYITKTSGLLLKRQLPYSLGGMISGSSTFYIWQNVGSSENKGVELALNTVNINASDFKWETNVTFTRNKEQITSLIDENDLIQGTDNSLLIGYPIQSFYTYKKIGIWQTEDSLEMAKYPVNRYKPGDIKVANTDDLGEDTIINGFDKTYIGARVPDWFCGFKNTFTYKSVDLSIYLYARWGQYINNELLGRYNPSGGGNGPAYLDYWTPENPTNDFPRPKQGQALAEYIGYESLTIVDGSFFKIKNISLGYTLPKKFSSRIKIGNLRLYGTISNILTITKSSLIQYYDPENSGSEKFPMSKQVIFGVDVNF